MPLQEFHHHTAAAAGKRKLENGEPNISNSAQENLNFITPDDEFVELLWENGQVVTQANRPKRYPFSSLIASIAGKSQAKIENDKSRAPGNEVTPPFLPSAGHVDDDILHWMNYAIDESIQVQTDYCCDVFSQFPESTWKNPVPLDNGFPPKDVVRGSEAHTKEIQISRQDFSVGSTSRTIQKSSITSAITRKQSLKSQVSLTCKPPERMGLLNFSNLWQTSGIEKEKTDLQSVAAPTSNIEEACNLTRIQDQAALSPLEKMEASSSNAPEKDVIRVKKSGSPGHEEEKAPEAVVASSNCSGYRPEAASNDPKRCAKRKKWERERQYHSEDLEDESVALKKPTSAKRSRAAEVHNLSERKRRDRINERMRALQELIPNCNKVDKASMLDEAIEYLKTLQLQVQMMSMGSGLFVPPMMLPPIMQHIGAHMGPYSAMGGATGLGSGFCYGPGMLHMNGSRGFPFVSAPSGASLQFSSTGLNEFSSQQATLPVFGIPGQGIPVSFCYPLQSGSFPGVNSEGNTGRMPETTPNVSSGFSCSTKDQQQIADHD